MNVCSCSNRHQAGCGPGDQHFRPIAQVDGGPHQGTQPLIHTHAHSLSRSLTLCLLDRRCARDRVRPCVRRGAEAARDHVVRAVREERRVQNLRSDSVPCICSADRVCKQMLLSVGSSPFASLAAPSSHSSFPASPSNVKQSTLGVPDRDRQRTCPSPCRCVCLIAHSCCSLVANDVFAIAESCAARADVSGSQRFAGGGQIRTRAASACRCIRFERKCKCECKRCWQCFCANRANRSGDVNDNAEADQPNQAHSDADHASRPAADSRSRLVAAQRRGSCRRLHRLGLRQHSHHRQRCSRVIYHVTASTRVTI